MEFDLQKVCSLLKNHVKMLAVLKDAQSCCEGILRDFRNSEEHQKQLLQCVGSKFSIFDVKHRFVSHSLCFENTDGFSFPVFCTILSLEAMAWQVGFFKYYYDASGEHIDESFHIFGYTKFL